MEPARTLEVDNAPGVAGTDLLRTAKSQPLPAQTDATEPPSETRSGSTTRPGGLRTSGGYLSLLETDRQASIWSAKRRTDALIQQNQGAAPLARRTLPLPPHNIDAQQWAKARFAVETSSDLSATERYVHLRLFGYEGLSTDSSDPRNVSVGGIRNSVLRDVMNLDDPDTDQSGDALSLYAVLKQLRALEGKTVPEWDESSVSITDLSVDEILDAQRIYLVRYLEGWTTAQQVHDSTILDRLGPPELSAQIADTIFHHGPTIAIPLLQNAVNDVIATLPAEVRERYGLDYLESDGILGTITASTLQTLASGPLKETFLLALRRRRSLKLITDGNYTGNNRLRVWGLSEDDVQNR